MANLYQFNDIAASQFLVASSFDFASAGRMLKKHEMKTYEFETAKLPNGRWTVTLWEEGRKTAPLYTTNLSNAYNTEEEAKQAAHNFLASHEKGKPYTVFQDRLSN
jgi:hypothetical protein